MKKILSTVFIVLSMLAVVCCGDDEQDVTIPNKEEQNNSQNTGQEDEVKQNLFRIPKEDINEWDAGILYNDSIYIVLKERTDSTDRRVYFNKITNKTEDGVLITLDNEDYVTECITKDSLYWVTRNGMVLNVYSVDRTATKPQTLYSSNDTRAIGVSLLDDIANCTSTYSNIKDVIRGNWGGLIGGAILDASLKYLSGGTVANGIGITKFVFDFFNDKSDDKMRFYYGSCDVKISPIVNYTDAVYKLNVQITGASTLPKVLPSEIKEWIVNYNIFENTNGTHRNIKQDRILNDGSFDITLSQLSEGTHTFNSQLLPHEVRGNSCSMFVLGSKPSYSISNIKQTRSAETVTIDFDFSYSPKKSSEIEYQGMELHEQNCGRSIATLGVNETERHITQTFDVSALRKDGNELYIDISVLYYFVTSHGSRQTYYVELKPYSIKVTASFSCPDSHHPHAIDLGLPSGTKWACCNVGATTPEGYGGYYAWGETSEKSVYNEVTYQYCTGVDTDGDGWYDKNWSYQDIGTDIAGTSYDVAHVRMGGPWRMPSHEQQMELMDYCTRSWTQQNGVNGILVKGKNGGQLFLPAAGCRYYSDLYYVGSYGYYWSSSLYPSYSNYAYDLYFYSSLWFWAGDYRGSGRSVRAVCP